MSSSLLTPAEDAWVRSKIVPLYWKSVAEMVPPRVLAIGGYQRTGKDTFAAELREDSLGSHGWTVYSKLGDAVATLRSFVGAPTVALADPLREIVFEMLDLPPKYNYEMNKDKPMPDHGGHTVRDYLKHVGAMGREIQCDSEMATKGSYWVKRVFMPHFVLGGDPKKIVCSDLRFRSERAAMMLDGRMNDMVYVRLFRSEVPIPPANVQSEHDLDAIEPDIVLVREAGEWEKFREAFPLIRTETYRDVGVIS